MKFALGSLIQVDHNIGYKESKERNARKEKEGAALYHGRLTCFVFGRWRCTRRRCMLGFRVHLPIWLHWVDILGILHVKRVLRVCTLDTNDWWGSSSHSNDQRFAYTTYCINLPTCRAPGHFLYLYLTGRSSPINIPEDNIEMLGEMENSGLLMQKWGGSSKTYPRCKGKHLKVLTAYNVYQCIGKAAESRQPVGRSPIAR